jgi:hypothetical protein
VQPMIGLCSIVFGGAPDPNASPPTSAQSCASGALITKIVPRRWRAAYLSMDERFSIRLGDGLPVGGRVMYAEISIVIEYQPWFIPIRRAKEFRFRTTAGADGVNRWLSIPMWK